MRIYKIANEEDQVFILEQADNILSSYKESQIWQQIIIFLNENDVDYSNWSDLKMLSYYLKNNLLN